MLYPSKHRFFNIRPLLGSECVFDGVKLGSANIKFLFQHTCTIETTSVMKRHYRFIRLRTHYLR